MAPARLAFGITTYCVAPIVLDDGSVYGTLCALDADSVEVSDEQMALLRTLAKLIAHAVDEERRREELEDRASARELLLREVSHDLRAPLTVVRSAAELIGRQYEDDGRLAMSSEMIVGASVRMTSMIDGLLDAEAHDAGIEPEEAEAVDLAAFIASIAVDARAMLSGSAVEVEAVGSGTVLAPPNRLRRVVTNLTANATRYTRRGHVRLSAHLEEGGVEITVADTGRGMDEDELAVLGEAFAKGAGSTGFGLGLSIVQRLTAAMGGRVNFASTQGEGTTATVSLPLPAAAPADAPAPD